MKRQSTIILAFVVGCVGLFTARSEDAFKGDIRIYMDDGNRYKIVNMDDPQVVIYDYNNVKFKEWSDVSFPDSIDVLGNYAKIVGIRPKYIIHGQSLAIPKYCNELQFAYKTDANDSTPKATWGSYFDVKEFKVHEDNERWATHYKGILYTKGLDTLVCCPTKVSGLIRFPETLETIGSHAFCTQSVIVVPASVKQIEPHAFNVKAENIEIVPQNPYYAAVNGVVINKKDNTIYDVIIGAVKSNTIIPDYLQKLPDYAFDGLPITTLSIENPGLEIGKGAFKNTLLKDVNLPEGLTTLPEGVFRNTPLQNIKLPDSLEEINDSAFYCTSFKEIVLPANLKGMGHSVFTLSESRQSDLKYVMSLSLIPPQIADDAFSDEIYSNAPLFVPDDAVSEYQQTPGWNRFISINAKSRKQDVSVELPYVIGEYDIHGRLADSTHKGLTIVKYSDGTVKKQFKGNIGK